MEFHEKLQALRKSRGMTQEELAAALFVSRTAVSKWESGRGYPSIDSLRMIAGYFSVTVDELLDADTALTLAEQETKAKLQNIRARLFGVLDMAAVLLVLLPLYPKLADGHVYAVNLLGYTGVPLGVRVVCGVVFAALAVLGVGQWLLGLRKKGKGQKAVTRCSMALGILAVLLLAATRQTYAVAMAFLLVMGKGILLYRQKE